MKTIRPAAIAAVILTLLVSLSGCFGLPSITGGGGTTTTTDSSLVGTSWSGTDSDGDTWLIDFQADNTVGFTYDGNAFDDATDTWVLAGGQLAITIAFSDGTATMTGPYTEGSSTIDLDGVQGDASWTLTLTKQ